MAATALGPVPVGRGVADGADVLLLRPEQVRVSGAADGCRAAVHARVSAGSHTRVTVSVGGEVLALQVVGDLGAAVDIRLVIDGLGIASAA